MVQAGDTVYAGQPIAFIASAGLSHSPHLHFQIYEPQTDPFDESAERTFWEATVPYAGDVFAVKDFRIFTETALDFKWVSHYTYSNVSSLFRNKNDSAELHPPRIFGADEDTLFIYWHTTRRPLGGTAAVKVLDPDDSLFFEKTYTSGIFPTRYLIPFEFAGAPGSPKPGRWKIQLSVGSTIYKSLEFSVGPKSIYAPLFSPVAGLSFWVGRAGAGFLLVDSLSGAVTYIIGTQTNAISIIDTVPGRPYVIVGSQSDQSYRNAFIPILATNATGLSDTFFVHLVDFSKPFRDEYIGIARSPAPPKNDYRLIMANPYSPCLPIWHLQGRNAHGHFSIYDLYGRLIRRFDISGKAGVFYWNGKDNRGHTVSAGQLIFRCKLVNHTFTEKVIFLP
jgi:hypothetical protein